jgi:hypothetical protein
MILANLQVAEIIKRDYTNTECFWWLNEITKNIVLITRDEGRIKFQITNPKFQINSKHQIPMTETKAMALGRGEPLRSPFGKSQITKQLDEISDE